MLIGYNEYNNNMSYILQFTFPVMKDKMYFHATRVLVDKPEKATKYENEKDIDKFEILKFLCEVGYKDFFLTIEKI